jgi:hydroxymethylglutaryl-CoA lyase
LPAEVLAGHFHDTAGRALANIDVALEHGVRVFDASCAGLGGCPFAPGAAGNVATEAVDSRLLTLGYETGLDHDRLISTARLASALRTSR